MNQRKRCWNLLKKERLPGKSGDPEEMKGRRREDDCEVKQWV